MDQLEFDLARVLAFPITRNARRVKSIALRLNDSINDAGHPGATSSPEYRSRCLSSDCHPMRLIGSCAAYSRAFRRRWPGRSSKGPNAARRRRSSDPHDGRLGIEIAERHWYRQSVEGGEADCLLGWQIICHDHVKQPLRRIAMIGSVVDDRMQREDIDVSISPWRRNPIDPLRPISSASGDVPARSGELRAPRLT